ncbi:DNA repair ATPase, partial [gamma proteobacterium BDW918]
MTKIAKQDFIFKKHMSVGEADAENDKSFLEECFVDIGDYEILEDTSTPQSIILGRTGIGKSALIEQLEKNSDRVIRIEPEELALRHISNSTILNFFEDLGVNLDIFYSLLWQHTLSVELIKNKYNIDCAQAKTNFIDSITALLSGKQKKQQALNYIEEWGDKFWVDTETRIKEFTGKLEASLKSSIDSNVPGVTFSGEAGAALSEEQKSEVIHYGKKVVSSVQIEKLSKIVNLLAEDIFTDPQKK